MLLKFIYKLTSVNLALSSTKDLHFLKAWHLGFWVPFSSTFPKKQYPKRSKGVHTTSKVLFNRFLKRAAGRGVGKGDFFHHFTVYVQGIKKHQGRHGLGRAGAPHLKINKIEKRLVLIILVIVFKHKINIKKYMFV